jgi:hypothetical protein
MNDKIDKMKNPGNQYKDDRFWSLTIDKAGNGHATIRFLPAPQGEDMPFVQTWSHSFQGPGGYYIENCLSTVNQTDPVNEMNQQLWKEGKEDTVRQRKRKLHYYANILVVDDPANPENNGKVFLFKFGKQIMDVINDALFPEDEEDEAINVFDFWEGANFKLRSKMVNGFINYTSSKFLKQKELFDGDESKLEAVWSGQHSLQAFTDPNNSDQFKTYDELKSKLIRVLGDEAVRFFGGSVPSESVAPSVGKTSEAQQLLQEDDEDEVDVTSLDSYEDDVSSDDEDDLPFDLDDDDDLDSFQSLAD